MRLAEVWFSDTSERVDVFLCEEDDCEVGDGYVTDDSGDVVGESEEGSDGCSEQSEVDGSEDCCEHLGGIESEDELVWFDRLRETNVVSVCGRK